jgi:sulfatase maturation enzyme AslB (radical SAM superfamily)
MEQVKEKHLDKQFVRSEEAKRIISSLENLNKEVIDFHKKNNTPLVVSIDGKIVHIKPEDL